MLARLCSYKIKAVPAPAQPAETQAWPRAAGLLLGCPRPRAVCLLCWPKRVLLPATKSSNKMKELATIQHFRTEKAVWELLCEGPAPGEGYLAAAQAIRAGSWGFKGSWGTPPQNRGV